MTNEPISFLEYYSSKDMPLVSPRYIYPCGYTCVKCPQALFDNGFNVQAVTVNC